MTNEEVVVEDSSVESGMESILVTGPFDQSLKFLHSHYYNLPLLEQVVALRIFGGPKSSVSRKGSWTTEGIIHVPKGGVFLTKKSPILINPTAATKSHRNSEEFYINHMQVESALEDSIRIKSAAETNLHIPMEIPAHIFGEEPITDYFFGKHAKDYGLFLEDRGIDYISINTSNNHSNPFARQMWIGSVDANSSLGCFWGLHDNVLMRGIRKKLPEEFRDKDRKQNGIPDPVLIQGMSDNKFNEFIKYVEGGQS